MKDLVSVCIPTYNGERYLQEALDSVKKQTYTNIEVIISDDQSTDSTLAICERFRSEVNFPVKIVNHEPAGIGANWNNSVRHSTGLYIKFLFQDDILLPHCIETMLKYMHASKLAIIASKREIIDENSCVVKEGGWVEKYGDLQRGAGLEVQDFAVLTKQTIKNLKFGYIINSNMIGEPCVTMFTRELFNRIGPFSIALKQMLDYEYWIRVLVKYKIGIIEEKLVCFRVHEEQTSYLTSLSKNNEADSIRQTFYQKLLRYTGSDIKKSYYIEKYVFLKKILLLKSKVKL
ncbi:glycosyltransferase [Kaistella yonginensis]|uniref:glycosyltransferase n=1 Tax=Kaistella yonginensis TaxID=658267 RepID=UPI0025B50B9D|nr:glycosyltransferase [Kaistella yonginensis]MDN3605675.1 glycosyltransferase [Kaistella yonginensis]